MATLSIITLAVGQMAANCYIVFDRVSKQGIIIDPGDDAEYISENVLREKITLTQIIATHGHFDHIMAAYALKLAFGIPFCIHKKDEFLVSSMAQTARHFLGVTTVDPKPSIDRFLLDGETIPVGGSQILVHHTPGHTPGSITLEAKEEGILWTGDTIFAEGGIGRTDHTYSNREDLKRSISSILAYPEDTDLLPGHGEKTSVGSEIRFHVQ